MGVKSLIRKAGGKAGDKIANLAVLSPNQLKEIDSRRNEYLSQKPNVDDAAAEEYTSRLIAASSIEIYNAYLKQLSDIYVPVAKEAEYDGKFDIAHNIRFINITKWVSDKKEQTLEKLVNVYQVLSNEPCNIALVFNRTCTTTNVYLAVTNTQNAGDNVNVENYYQRLIEAVKGNFPGSEWNPQKGVGVLPPLNNGNDYSVAIASNIPAEKSEKFISQTIEKLLDGVVPETKEKEYTIILLATPIHNIEERKLKLAGFYTGLSPYSSWSTNFTYTESDATNSSATFGLNAGVSAGIQQGQNSSVTNSSGTTDSSGSTVSDTTGSSETNTTGNSNTSSTNTTNTDTQSTANGTTETSTHSKGTSDSNSESTTQGHSDSLVIFTHNGSETVGSSSSTSVTDALAKGTTSTETFGKSIAESIGKSITDSTSKAVASSVSKTIANTLGQAVSSTVSTAAGIYKGINYGANFGANFARSSNITATVGKNEGITQSFTNYSIKHTLEILEEQMKRYEQCTALGMWDFAAYIISEDKNVASNVAHSYLALTQGEKSYASQTAINLWRGDMGENSRSSREICDYLRELRHPLFGLNPVVIDELPNMNVYPSVVSAAIPLSGKELAYSLNFPQKSLAGFPVIECAEFGRNVVSYDSIDVNQDKIELGHVFYMNHKETTEVTLSKESLASHTFITGSTGSGKSNTVFKLLEEAYDKEVTFLAIEPAKGEYKNIFGKYPDVNVFGTNPQITELLKINPFSFPSNVHVYEHIDRLVEIFNACWPMYAAMPAVLKHAIEMSYEDTGWSLLVSENKFDNTLYPCFNDVLRNIKIIIDSSEYDSENKGAYKGALMTRIQALATGLNSMIFTDDEISEKKLFEENTIIDLSRIGSTETKSLIMGMLVMKLQEYRISSGDSFARLKHLTIIEEAHQLLKRVPNAQPTEGGNLVGKSVEMIANAIAEMRTYGEGFVIVDQAPGLLDQSVIRNTNTKIILRLPDQEDRELVGKAAGLTDDQILEIAKFPCGVAAVYQNEWVTPVLCKVDRSNMTYGNYAWTKNDNQNIIAPDDNANRLKLAEYISSGEKIDPCDIKSILKLTKSLKLESFISASIIDMLLEPSQEIKMTKVAPLMAAIFPKVYESVERSCLKGYESSLITRQAENALLTYTNGQIADQVRRDIIQANITYYLFIKNNRINDLEEWSRNGGLK